MTVTDTTQTTVQNGLSRYELERIHLALLSSNHPLDLLIRDKIAHWLRGETWRLDK